jgi:hypothetical protein
VYVGGIPYYSSEDDIRSFFEGCGSITALDCMTFPESGKFRGIAILTFKVSSETFYHLLYFSYYCSCRYAQFASVSNNLRHLVSVLNVEGWVTLAFELTNSAQMAVLLVHCSNLEL